jgi:hypothetical protein
MANLISLHLRQAFLSAGEPVAYAKAYFRISGTDTQVDVYSEVGLLNIRSQPVEHDADGVMPPCYIGTTDPLRVLLTDENDVPLPGYPMDNITPLSAEAVGASTVSFSPTAAVPETDVQAAIESLSALFSEQSTLSARALTPYDTGGTGNLYTITPTPAITAYGGGQSFMVRPNRANTGAARLNINGLGDREIRKQEQSGTVVPLSAGEIQIGREFVVYDNGTYFMMTLGRDYPIGGSNANGRYIRFWEGTMICYATFSASIACTTSNTAVGGFRSSNTTWTFPFPFVGTPIVVSQAGNANSVSVTTGLLSTTSLEYLHQTITTQAAATRVANLIAVGRWY